MPNRRMTLEEQADVLLRADQRAHPQGPKVLFREQLYQRMRREILCQSGTPDIVGASLFGVAYSHHSFNRAGAQ